MKINFINLEKSRSRIALSSHSVEDNWPYDLIRLRPLRRVTRRVISDIEKNDPHSGELCSASIVFHELNPRRKVK